MSSRRRALTPKSATRLDDWHTHSPESGAGRTLMLWLLAIVYIGFGAFHLLKPDSFLAIMPPLIPYPRNVVLFTGACEVLGGLGLFIPATRRLAAVMLALYALCVWPANIYHALSGIHVNGLPDSWWYHGPRLAFQLVLIWWPLFAAGVTRRPFGTRI